LVIIQHQSSEVGLLHQSLRNALLANSPPRDFLARICDPAEVEHAKLAVACLDYLSLSEFNIEAPTSNGGWQELKEKHPFLEYAALNWPYHAESAGSDSTEILDHFRTFAASRLNSNLAFRLYSANTPWVFPGAMPALQIAAFFGVGWLGIAIIRAGADVHELAAWGQSPLHQAARGGARDLLDVLVEKGVKVDIKDNGGETTLHFAAHHGQVAIMMAKYLVEVKKLKVSESGWYGMTPLHYAAEGGYPDLVTMLLDNGADPRKTDDKGYTPLHSASLAKHSPMATAPRETA
jgi:hypothetical protein